MEKFVFFLLFTTRASPFQSLLGPICNNEESRAYTTVSCFESTWRGARKLKLKKLKILLCIIKGHGRSLFERMVPPGKVRERELVTQTLMTSTLSLTRQLRCLLQPKGRGNGSVPVLPARILGMFSAADQHAEMKDGGNHCRLLRHGHM